MKTPYERIIQWAVGPLSALIGLGSVAVVHSSITQSESVNVATFALTSLATLAGHWKWLSNLTKWWDKQSKGTPIQLSELTATKVAVDAALSVHQQQIGELGKKVTALQLVPTPETPAEEAVEEADPAAWHDSHFAGKDELVGPGPDAPLGGTA